MTAAVKAALALWGLETASFELAAARENAVYRVDAPGARYALRLHRVGYRSDAELWSELCWMAAAARGGLQVPAPVAARSGEMLHRVGGVQVDLLTWLPGQTLDHALTNAPPDRRRALFARLGRDMARLHAVCDAWTPPAGFARAAWDMDGLLGDAPLWDRFWENPGLDPDTKALFTRFRDRAKADLAARHASLDYGLIHADLVGANVLVEGTDLSLIDFDDGGYGYRMFDIATALLKHMDAPDYLALQQALLQGYQAERAIDASTLNLFLTLRAMTYVGWNITRQSEPQGETRNARFIATAKTRALLYLRQVG